MATFGKRPLKTYGSKRAASADCPEPANKKRKSSVDRNEKGTDREEDEVSEAGSCIVVASSPLPLSPQPQLPQPALPPQSARKGTITSYFKVVPSSATSPASSTGSNKDCSTANLPPSSTPPSSPPAPLTRRKKQPRRLTTRHTAARDLRASEYDDDEQDAGEDNEEENVHQNSKRNNYKTLSAAGPLAKSTPTSLNKHQQQQPRDGKKNQRGEKPPSPSTAKQSNQPSLSSSSLQTTLSLSRTDRGFSECPACGLLYNPLHPKDVALHARTHAAALRQREKRQLRQR